MKAFALLAILLLLSCAPSAPDPIHCTDVLFIEHENGTMERTCGPECPEGYHEAIGPVGRECRHP